MVWEDRVAAERLIWDEETRTKVAPTGKEVDRDPEESDSHGEALGDGMPPTDRLGTPYRGRLVCLLQGAYATAHYSGSRMGSTHATLVE